MEALSTAQSAADFAAMLTKGDKHALAVPMLNWIVSSNTALLEKLPARRRLECMTTPHQYYFYTAPAARETIFAEGKKQHGTTFAFHGSPIYNWHSILRSGLINASGTAMQANGAAHGAGVYMSPEVHTALGYCRHQAHTTQATKSEKRFLSAYTNMFAIALVEVVKSPELKKHGRNIWTHSNHDFVVTRMLFVYEGHQPNAVHTETNKTFQQQLAVASETYAV